MSYKLSVAFCLFILWVKQKKKGGGGWGVESDHRLRRLRSILGYIVVAEAEVLSLPLFKNSSCRTSHIPTEGMSGKHKFSSLTEMSSSEARDARCSHPSEV